MQRIRVKKDLMAARAGRYGYCVLKNRCLISNPVKRNRSGVKIGGIPIRLIERRMAACASLGEGFHLKGVGRLAQIRHTESGLTCTPYDRRQQTVLAYGEVFGVRHV